MGALQHHYTLNVIDLLKRLNGGIDIDYPRVKKIVKIGKTKKLRNNVHEK